MTKRIKTRFNFRSARNAEHYGLHHDILDVLDEKIVAAFELFKVHEPYMDYFKYEVKGFLQNRRYKETHLIKEKNASRVGIFAYLAQNVSTARNLPTQEIADAAERLYYLLEPYRNLSRLNYASISARMVDLLTELRKEEYAADLETLGMTDTVETLYQENEEFRTIYKQRSDEKLARHNAEKMKVIRLKVDDAAKACFEMINAQYLLAYMNGDAEKMAALGAIIDKINALLLELQKTLSRVGIAAKPVSSESEDTLPDDTTEDEGSTEDGDSSTDGETEDTGGSDSDTEEDGEDDGYNGGGLVG